MSTSKGPHHDPSALSNRPAYNYEEAFRLTQSPQPDFTPGPTGSAAPSAFLEEWRSKGEKAGFEDVDPTKIPPGELYRLLVGGITPRPVAFVSTIAQDGTHNLSPFSYFQMINHNPPLLIVSFSSPGAGKEKDSLANIRFRKTFTVNIISEPFVEGANFTSTDAPSNVDEWYGSGLTMEKSTLIEPPRVKESAFSMECELWKDLDLGHPGAAPTGTLVIGLMKLIHVRKDILIPSGDDAKEPARPYTVDAAKLRAVSRLGGVTYARIGEAFESPRPLWDDVKHVYDKRSEKEK